MIDRSVVASADDLCPQNLDVSRSRNAALHESESGHRVVCCGAARSPLDPLMPVARSGSAFAHLFAGRYDAALSHAEQALQENPNLHPALRVSAAASAFLGRIEQAQKTLARLRRVDPALRISNLSDIATFRPDDFAKVAEGLRIAGLPE